MEAFSRIGTKSGKNKTQGLKWKSPKNVGTKSSFSPRYKVYILLIINFDEIGQLEVQFASMNICNAESATNVEQIEIEVQLL